MGYNTVTKIIQLHDINYIPENIEYIKNNKIYYGRDIILSDSSSRTFFDYNSPCFYKNSLLIFNFNYVALYETY